MIRAILIILGVGIGVTAASAKGFPWGEVRVLASTDESVEFEWRIDWPSAGAEDPEIVNWDLPGARLTPFEHVSIPLTLDAFFHIPPGVEVSLTIDELHVDELAEVSPVEVDRFFRARRYIDLGPLGSGAVRGGVSAADRSNAVDSQEESAFLEISSQGRLRGYELIGLQSHPLRLNRDQDTVEQLRLVRGRLMWSRSDDSAWDVPAERFASPIFQRIAQAQVVNSESIRPVEQGRPGLRLMDHVVPGDAGEFLQFQVEETGIYQLTGQQLAVLGVELESVPGDAFQLFDSEGEIPLLMEDGGDGKLDRDDRLIFFGRSVDSIYATANSYVLRWSGHDGLRFGKRPSPPSGAGLSSVFFRDTAHFEEDLHYWQNMVDGEGEDHWFWFSQLNGPEQRDYEIELRGIAAASSEPVQLRVEMKGLSSIPGVLEDHHTRIYFNGELLSDDRWDGNERVILGGGLQVADLVEGRNTVTVEVVGDLSVDLDQVFVNWIEVDYPRRLAAVEGELPFGNVLGERSIHAVVGFRNENVRLFDVTDSRAPIQLTAIESRLESQGFVARFGLPGGGRGKYLVVDEFAVRSPENVRLFPRTGWGRPENQADYLIVTHRPYVDALEPLVEQRRRDGHSVAVIPVDELYNEFTAGLPTPDAITRFIKYAYNNWRAPAPAYLLLVGDSTLDPRDIFGSGTPNQVPTVITDMRFFGESVTDDLFVRVDGDDFLPDLLVGRFPSESVEGLQTMVDKTLSYQVLDADQDWNSRVLVVADDDSSVYEELSEELAAIMGDEFDVDRVYLSQYPPGVPYEDILNRLNEGRALINYTGHGSRSTWGVGDVEGVMFENADAAVLTNAEALTFVTVANCLNGFFVARSTRPCLAEVFLRNSNGGAVGAWAPTSLGFPSGHRLLVGNFYRSIFEAGELGLGAAVLGAKIATLTDAEFFGDQVQSYTFFGDPVLELALPDRLRAPTLSLFRGEDGQVELRYEARAGRRYEIWGTDQLGSDSNWSLLTVESPGLGRVPVDLSGGQQFYRVRVSIDGETPEPEFQ